MPGSTNLYKREVARHVATVANLRKTGDVGCGSGVWADLLGHGVMDAVEVHSPYLTQYGLEKKYRRVYDVDVRRLDLLVWHGWEYAIFGDVLEHMDVATAQGFVRMCTGRGMKILVAVPYLSPQPASLGNSFEAHVQEDLTPEVMAERYPELRLLIGDETYGYYVNYETPMLTPDRPGTGDDFQGWRSC